MADYSLIKKRFISAQDSYDDHAKIQKKVAQYLAYLIENKVGKVEGSALDIGCGTGLATKLIDSKHNINKWVLNDLIPIKPELIDSLKTSEVETYIGRVEDLDLTQKFNLIMSSSTFHWLEKPDEVIAKCAKQLNDNGVLAIALYGTRNLLEIDKLTDHGLKYHSLDDWSKWVQDTGLTLLHAEKQQVIDLYDSPLEALKSLKKTGVTGTSGTPFKSVDTLRKLELQWKANFSVSSGQVTLSWRPMWLIARK